MTDPINESFSALLDNEASNMDIQRLLNAMDNQPDKLTDWKSIASGHSKCRGEKSFDVLSRVNETLYAEGQIDQLPINQIENSNSHQSADVTASSLINRSKKWLGSATIAASVCAATVLTINGIGEDQTGQFDQTDVLATGNPTVAPVGQVQQQLKQHYQQHTLQTSFGTPIDPSAEVKLENEE